MSPSAIPGRIYARLKSLRFTAGIITALIVSYFLSLIIPQRLLFDSAGQYLKWKEESVLNGMLVSLGLTEIATSPLTVCLLGLFFTNLFLVTLDRIPALLRKTYLYGGTPRIDAMRLKASPARVAIESSDKADAVRARLGAFFLRQRWYLIPGAADGTYLAIRHRFTPLGFLLFHGSFFFCLIGAILLAYSRFSGNIGVAEGETFKGQLEQIEKIGKRPLIFTELPAVTLKVNRIETLYEEGTPADLKIDLVATVNGLERHEIVKVNEPLKQGAFSVVAHNVGLAPLVAVTAPDGAPVDELIAKLNVLKGRVDSFTLGSRNQYAVSVRYYPDYALYNGVETTRSQEPRNPAFHLLIARQGKTLYDGTVRLGETAEMDGFRVSFRDLRYWAEFQVIREYGHIPLIFGFLLAVMGLIMRLIFYQKRIQIAVEEVAGSTSVVMLGNADLFQLTFTEELLQLARVLQSELAEETLP